MADMKSSQYAPVTSPIEMPRYAFLTLKPHLLPVASVSGAVKAGTCQLLIDCLQHPHVHLLGIIQGAWEKRETGSTALLAELTKYQ